LHERFAKGTEWQLTCDYYPLQKGQMVTIVSSKLKAHRAFGDLAVQVTPWQDLSQKVWVAISDLR
jgi:hypothetical protein